MSFFSPGKSELNKKVLMGALSLLVACAMVITQSFPFVKKYKINK